MGIDGVYRGLTYQLAKQNQYFEIKRGRIFKMLTETKYTNPIDQEILIQQQDSWKIKKGDYVFMFGRQVSNAIIDFTKAKNLIVRDSIVIRLERKNAVMRWFSKRWKIFWGYYEK